MAEVSKVVNASVCNAGNGKTDVMFESITEQLFDEVRKVYRESGKVTDEVLSALNCVFQGTLLPALDLLDKHSVTLLSCPAGRQLYQVIGSSGTPYICFKSSSYCSCPAYKFSVLKKEEHSMCKHVLCVRLSTAMGTYKTLNMSDQELANVLSQLD